MLHRSFNEIRNSFEESFLSCQFAKQVRHCKENELAPLFMELFKKGEYLLEAGCGSGRWNVWLKQHGISSIGLDCSERLCAAAKREFPECGFISGDMKNMPFFDKTFDGVIALGSVEHDPEGPGLSLKEFYRVLKRGGIAVITVPYGGRLRRFMRYVSRPALIIKSRKFLRRIFKKKGWNGVSLTEARKNTILKWHPHFSVEQNGYFFYEYEFSKEHMRDFLRQTGFTILKEFVGFGNEGILHNFGKISGKWNRDRADVDFTIFGRLSRKLLPTAIMGHMLCYVVKK
jgi:ubiquinone/menaquinone biosynthesis C-methylase UbiE